MSGTDVRRAWATPGTWTYTLTVNAGDDHPDLTAWPNSATTTAFVGLHGPAPTHHPDRQSRHLRHHSLRSRHHGLVQRCDHDGRVHSQRASNRVGHRLRHPGRRRYVDLHPHRERGDNHPDLTYVGKHVTMRQSNIFHDQLAMTGSNGAATYTVTGGASVDLHVSASGAVTTAGVLAPTSYTISGTDTDAFNDTGTWTYTLTVAAPTGGGSSTNLVQTSPTSGVRRRRRRRHFHAGPIQVSNANGPVTFVTTTTSPPCEVSASGAITITGSLTSGSYNVAGTDSDTVRRRRYVDVHLDRHQPRDRDIRRQRG